MVNKGRFTKVDLQRRTFLSSFYDRISGSACFLSDPQACFTLLFSIISQIIIMGYSVKKQAGCSPWPVGNQSPNRGLQHHPLWCCEECRMVFSYVPFTAEVMLVPFTTVWSEISTETLGPWSLFWRMQSLSLSLTGVCRHTPFLQDCSRGWWYFSWGFYTLLLQGVVKLSTQQEL